MSTDTNIRTEEQKAQDKEINFRQMEAKYERQIAQERQAREEAERKVHEMSQRQTQVVEEEEEDETDPYVDHKKLNKKLAKFGQQSEQKTQQTIKNTAQSIREEIKREMWLENNPDFYDTLSNHATKLAERSPALAKAILSLPDTFERQQLVYQNIKELGIDKPVVKESSIQNTIDANRKSPFYQPTGMGTAPYSSQSDFSKTGQKSAYDKMQELKSRLRLG